MDQASLLRWRVFSRNFRYVLTRSVRRLPWGHLIYDQSVSAFRKEQKQIPPFYVGNAERGQEILRDHFPLPNNKTLGLREFWNMRQTSPDLSMRRMKLSIDIIRKINRFDWLGDLYALHLEQKSQNNQPDELDLDFSSENRAQSASQISKDIILGWISNHQHWSAISWHVPTLSRRINNWLYFYQVFFGSSSLDFDRNFFQSISRQLSHLRYSVIAETQGFDRITALVCCVNASMSLTHEAKRYVESVEWLSMALDELCRSDTAEVFSSPRLCLELYLQLHQLCYGFTHNKISIPPAIAHALEILEQAIQKLKLKNNSFPHFHSTWDIPIKQTRLPQKHPRKQRGLSNLSSSKRRVPLLKIVNDGLSVIVDATNSPKPGTGIYTHASPLAMEIYDGAQPLIINATPPPESSLHDRQEFRQNSSHSMPLLEDFPIGRLRSDGRFGRGSGYQTVHEVQHEAIDSDSGLFRDRLYCQHNAYQSLLGADLAREIIVNAAPKEPLSINGCDSLEFGANLRSNAPLRLVSLFHLHPDLTVQELDGGGMMILTKKQHQAWRFDPLQKHVNIHSTTSIPGYNADGGCVTLTTLWMAIKIPEAEPYKRYGIEWQITRLTR